MFDLFMFVYVEYLCDDYLFIYFSQAIASDDPSFSPLTGFCSNEIMSSQIAPLTPFVESESIGQVRFHLGYDFRSMTLNLKLICAEQLPAKDFLGTSDPYVKIMLLPDRKHQLVSNIKRKSLNPRWNELFAFEGYMPVFCLCSCKHFWVQKSA